MPPPDRAASVRAATRLVQAALAACASALLDGTLGCALAGADAAPAPVGTTFTLQGLTATAAPPAQAPALTPLLGGRRAAFDADGSGSLFRPGIMVVESLALDAPWVIIDQSVVSAQARLDSGEALAMPVPPRAGRDSYPLLADGVVRMRTVLETLAFDEPMHPAGAIASFSCAVQLVVADSHALRALPVALRPGVPVAVFGLCMTATPEPDLVLELAEDRTLRLQARASQLKRLASLACYDLDGARMPTPHLRAEALEAQRWRISGRLERPLGRVDLELYASLHAGIATADREDLPFLGTCDPRARTVHGSWRELPLPTALAVPVRLAPDPAAPAATGPAASATAAAATDPASAPPAREP